jgi:hypothetical protein
MFYTKFTQLDHSLEITRIFVGNVFKENKRKNDNASVNVDFVMFKN